MRRWKLAALMGLEAISAAWPGRACGQAANAVTAADDAFGTSIGHEALGLYTENSVRGFSPTTAGNYRIEGMYFDLAAEMTSRVEAGYSIRVGQSAQGSAFPAPTGVIDAVLRTSGNKWAVTPLVSLGPFGTYGAEVDVQVPLARDRLSFAAGGAAYHHEFANGGRSDTRAIGIVPRWHPAPGIEVTAFWSGRYASDETANGKYVPLGSFPPPPITQGRFVGPDWAARDSTATNMGLLGRGEWGGWTLRAAVFRSVGNSGIAYENLVNIDQTSFASRTVLAYPASRTASDSGEIRAVRAIVEGPRRHLFTVSLRSRAIAALYGDSIANSYPIASPGAVINPPQPNFAFGPLTSDTVHQLTGGISYRLFWPGAGSLSLGLQRTHYLKQVAAPGLAAARQVDDMWLPSVSTAVNLGPRLLAYASYVKGLENAGTAPGNAANGNQVLRAISTRQWDAGIKWTPTTGSTLIIGYFNVSKPYLAINDANFYGPLGSEVHKGIEVSLTAALSKDMTVVGGAVFGSPRVTGSANALGTIGPRPVGQPDTTAQINVNYHLPFARSITLDGSVSYNSSTPGRVDNLIAIAGYASLALGARYAFTLAGRPMLLRVQMLNATDAYSYSVVSSGVYRAIDQRSVSAYLTADF